MTARKRSTFQRRNRRRPQHRPVEGFAIQRLAFRFHPIHLLVGMVILWALIVAIGALLLLAGWRHPAR
jgi:hypothetical protein